MARRHAYRLRMNLLDAVVAATRDAGMLIEAARRSHSLNVRQKGAEGPVTEADRRADDLLRRQLTAIEPAGWLSEETADDGSRLTSERVWVVDPLDGTKEFIAGVPEYAVAVALVDRGAAVLGVIHNPATGDTLSAMRGQGAHLNGHVVHVAEGDTLLASRSETARGEFAAFQADWKIQSTGSIAWKLALIATGRAAATLSRGPKWEWDVGAGSLIVGEAGGVVTDMFGAELRFNQPFPKTRGVLAGAPAAHARALETLRSIGASDRMSELDGHLDGQR